MPPAAPASAAKPRVAEGLSELLQTLEKRPNAVLVAPPAPGRLRWCRSRYSGPGGAATDGDWPDLSDAATAAAGHGADSLSLPTLF